MQRRLWIATAFGLAMTSLMCRSGALAAMKVAPPFGLKARSGIAQRREADPKGAGQDRPASAMTGEAIHGHRAPWIATAFGLAMTSLMCRSGASPR